MNEEAAFLPELPEVETIVRALRHPSDWTVQPEGSLAAQPGILGRSVANALVLWDRTIAQPSVPEFLAQIAGLTVTDVKRRGKFIHIQMGTRSLIFHLRMSGDLRVAQAGQPLATHDRLVVNFDDGTCLAFNDARKFGRVWLVEDDRQVFGKLGPDPFDASLTADEFHQMFQKKSRHIKPLLLDQTFLAGLGNIYTDEALFRAGIHPLTSSSELDYPTSEKLLQAIRSVLAEGIDRNGASIDWVYRGGTFQNQFNVYRRTGQPCRICGTPIVKINVGQRGTHFCPTCQPAYRVHN